MAVRKYPGYGKAVAGGGEFLVLDDNDYSATIVAVKVTVDQEKREDVWDFTYTLGPDQPEQADGSDVSGKKIHDFLRIPLEGHEKYDDWIEMRLGMLKARAVAAGLGDKKGDMIPEPEEFLQKDIVFSAKKRSYEDKKTGKERFSNDFSRFRAYKE
jgi:hypothetical protein